MERTGRRGYQLRLRTTRPVPQRAANSFLTLIVRTDLEAEDLLPTMRSEIQALKPDLPIQTLVTMEGHVNRVLMPQRMGRLC